MFKTEELPVNMKCLVDVVTSEIERGAEGADGEEYRADAQEQRTQDAEQELATDGTQGVDCLLPEIALQEIEEVTVAGHGPQR